MIFINKGLIHIYYGNGKGKTTASVGLCVRALSNDFKVLMVQFLKSEGSAECNLLKNFKNYKILCLEERFDFTYKLNDTQIDNLKKLTVNLFDKMENLIKKENYDMVILDEILCAVNENIISNNKLVNFIKTKPVNTELILTGTEPPEEIKNYAHYISEIKKIKHPFDSNIMARKGIEY